MRTGLPFETDELPLVLWECAAESVQGRAFITNAYGRMPKSCDKGTEFDKAVMLLNSDERLAFLLHMVYGLPPGWVMLITGWSARTVVALCEAGAVQVSRALRLSPMRRARLTTRV
jgi:DNA-directed RNA polymerase specialized sigma24 family protein